jgi:uncharacterized membrane protein
MRRTGTDEQHTPPHAEARSGAPPLVSQNIDTIVRVEEQAIGQRSRAEAFSDRLVRFVGSFGFVVAHLLIVAAWLVINAGLIPVLPRFDPYPYPLLSPILSLEGVLLVAFVLMQQTRIGVVADRRNHLDLQVNLLTEREVTKVIQLLQRIGTRMGIEDEMTDHETSELGRETTVEHLVEELRGRLPGE